jgi:protein-tyrosine phosphatase
MASWWIEEPGILGSSNPEIDLLRQLRQEGFVTIISLLDEAEQKPKYDVQEVKTLGFDRYKIPVRDFNAPTLENFRKFIRIINEALPKGKILVHCQGGSGRTGTMAAAYWIYRGLSVEKAIKKLRQSNEHAIENQSQRDSLFIFADFIKSNPIRPD